MHLFSDHYTMLSITEQGIFSFEPIIHKLELSTVRNLLNSRFFFKKKIVSLKM